MTREHPNKRDSSDFPAFVAALEKIGHTAPKKGWTVLLVSAGVKFGSFAESVLGELNLDGQTVRFIRSDDFEQAKTSAKANPDAAMILIDSQSGDKTLDFIRYIRESLVNPLVRILTVTGNDEQIPPLDTVLELDIAYERGETVSTKDRFAATIASVLKTYQALITMELYSEELQKMNAWLKTLLASVGDGVITTDTSGTIQTINPVASHMTRLARSDAKGKSLNDVLTFKDTDTGKPLTLNWGVRTTKKPATAAVLETPNQRKCQVSYTMSPIFNQNDQLRGFIFVIRDMTEHLNMEYRLRQQQKLESLGTLTSGIAHEIKNPLTVIMNTADMLNQKFAKDDEAKQFTKKIVEETHRVSKIATNMLAFARQDVFEDAMVATGMEEIIESVLSLVRSVVAKDDIEFKIDVPDELPNVQCRTQQIQQVLINLITNARDALNQRYTGTASRKTIFIRCSMNVDEAGKWVRTTIEDRATGIRPSIIDRIFDPFFTTKQSGTGTGLGLSVSHNIISKHGGRLSAESELNAYTRFHMDLLPAEKTTSII